MDVPQEKHPMKHRRTVASIAVAIVLLTATPQVVNAEWEKAGGPEGDCISALCVAGTDIFAGTPTNGVFLSSDTGTSWRAVSSGLPTSYVISFATSGNNIFAATRDSGVFLSSNNGSTWTAVNTGLPLNPNVTSLAVNGNTIFAGTPDSGVYLSTDNGTNWTAVNSGLPDHYIYSLAVCGTDVIAGTSSGIYRSTDNGTSWNIADGSPQNETILSLAVSGSTIFAGTRHSIYRITENGTYWNDLSFASSNPQIFSFAVSDSIILAVTGYGGVFRSTDAGMSWDSVSSNLPYHLINCFAVRGNIIIAGTQAGIFLSTDYGTSWKAFNSGLPTNLNITSFTVSGSDIISATSYGGVFRSTDSGTSWAAINPRVMMTTTYYFAVNGSNFITGTFGDGIFLSTDTGKSWNTANSGLTTKYFYSLAVNGSNIFAGSLGGVFLSTNNGTNWSQVNSDLSSNLIFESLFPCGNNLFAMCDLHYITDPPVTQPRLYLSTDNGISWKAVSLNSGIPVYNVTSLTMIGSNTFAGIGGSGILQTANEPFNGVLLSTDSGTTWSVVNSGLTDSSVYSLAVSGSNLYAGTNGGVFLSNYNGTTWTAVNTGLTDLSVKHLAISGNNLFAVTRGNSVWRCPLSDFPETGAIGNPEPTLSPRNTSGILSTGRSGSTQFITFSTPHRDRITITLHDLAGHAVRTLADGQYGPGPQTLFWNSGSLAPGGYMVKMRTGTNTSVKNVLLVR